jgi:hypothetical protein
VVAWFALIIGTQQRPKLSAAFHDGVGVLGWRGMQRYVSTAVFVAPLAVMAVIAISSGDRHSANVRIAAGVLVFSLCSWFVFQHSHREKYYICDERVERASPWTGSRTIIRWESVKAVQMDGLRRVVMISDTGKIIGIASRLDGIGDFAAAALRHLPARVLQEAPHVEAILQGIDSLPRAHSRVD